MIFSTITQDMLKLTVDKSELPTQYSSNIQLKFVQDTTNFNAYIPTVYASVFDSQFIKCGDILNKGGSIPIEDGIFKLPANILNKDGFLAIGIVLTKEDENVALGPVIYKIKANVGGLSPLPSDTDEWQQVVIAFVEQLYNQDYKPLYDQALEDIKEAVQTANTASDNANLASQNVQTAYENLGDYKVENGVMYFKKADGTWNETGVTLAGQTTVKKDETVLAELDLDTVRTATPTTVKVQLKDTSGNTFYVETSADNVYLKGTDGTEISQQNLNEKFGQLINLVAFYSANPTTVLADLKKYITTIS